MTKEQWLDKVSVFDLGLCPYHKRPVKLETRNLPENPKTWCIKMHEWVFGKDRDWHWEPNPSSRTEEFIENTRFGSYQEAYEFWLENVKSVMPLYIGE